MNSNQTRSFAGPAIAALIAIIPIASHAADTPPPLPDPAAIKIPDVTPSHDPKVREEGYKFYYFHNPGVSFSEAVQDLRECRAHLVPSGPVAVPGFIPWGEAHQTRPIEVPYSVLGAIILPKIWRGQDSGKMRRCMGTRGYARYAIPESAWKTLNEGDEEQPILMQAKLASSPKPDDEEVTERRS